jgi:hypothetical protein
MSRYSNQVIHTIKGILDKKLYLAFNPSDDISIKSSLQHFGLNWMTRIVTSGQPQENKSSQGILDKKLSTSRSTIHSVIGSPTMKKAYCCLAFNPSDISIK